MKILVTGGTGFLGKYVVTEIEKRKYKIKAIGSNHDLTQFGVATKIVDSYRPNVIVHLAAACGGIKANINCPGNFFRDNILMGINIIDAARLLKVEKIIYVGTTCSYPKNTPVPFREENIWSNFPEKTNAPYGIAKRALLVMLQAYRKQYGLNGIYLIPSNLYGPGDHFDLENSHVIPALIRKFYEAKINGEKAVEIWGTGNACREFLYAKDAATGIVDAMEKYNGNDPVNLGTGCEISIRDLVTLIKKKVDFNGDIEWNTKMPDGQPRRCLDVSKAAEFFGFRASTSLSDGLDETIQWYIDNRENILKGETEA